MCTCTNQGPYVTRGSGTLGCDHTHMYFQSHQWRWVPSCELQSTLRQILSCSMYPQGRCVPAPTRDPTSRADPEHWGVTTFICTFNLTSGDGCHFCELQSTLRQTLNCSMYPQGRCVPAPTRDPTARVDPEHWGCDHNS